jgi:hypothetical protein
MQECTVKINNLKALVNCGFPQIYIAVFRKFEKNQIDYQNYSPR